MFDNLKGNLSRLGSRTKFVVQKHSPEICLVGGVITFGLTIYAACKATMKAEEVLDKYQEAKDKIANSKMAAEDPEIPEEEKEKRGITYTEEDEARDKMIAFRDLAFGMAKKYWPVVLCGALSLGLFFSAYKITSARLTGAIGAYTALDGAFQKYRERVKDEVGEEREREIRTGVVKKTGYVKEVNDVGENVVTEKEVDQIDNDWIDQGPTVVLFSEDTSTEFKKGSPIYNEAFLKGKENEFNFLLTHRGYLFESEVRRALGLKVTDESNLRGWILDPANMPAAATRPIDMHIRQVFRESGDHVLSSGRIVKEVSCRDWTLEFDTQVIWNLVHIWEDRYGV